METNKTEETQKKPPQEEKELLPDNQGVSLSGAPAHEDPEKQGPTEEEKQTNEGGQLSGTPTHEDPEKQGPTEEEKQANEGGLLGSEPEEEKIPLPSQPQQQQQLPRQEDKEAHDDARQVTVNQSAAERAEIERLQANNDALVRHFVLDSLRQQVQERRLVPPPQENPGPPDSFRPPSTSEATAQTVPSVQTFVNPKAKQRPPPITQTQMNAREFSNQLWKEEAQQVTEEDASPEKVGEFAKSQGYECPVCFILCADPVKTKCGHFLCLGCSRKILEVGQNSCPMCRKFFDQAFRPEVDKELQQKVKEFSEEAFAERKAQLVNEGAWLGEGSVVKLTFGNQHELVTNPRPNVSGDRMMAHRWAMFCTLNHNDQLTERFVKQVQYQLHPTYPVRDFTLNQAPFLLSRCAWGYFNINVEIQFQPWTALAPLKINHMLRFSGQGKIFHVFLEARGESQAESEVDLAPKLRAALYKISKQSCHDD